MKPIIKFNGGRGAILCHGCSKILKSDLTSAEFKGKSNLFYCNKCFEKNNMKKNGEKFIN